MAPFERLLAELFKIAVATSKNPAVSDDRLFYDGDAEHLARWLNRGGADEIRKEIFRGPFDFIKAFNFVGTVLAFRRRAVEWDRVNKKLPAVKRSAADVASIYRKRAKRMLTNSEMTPQEYADLIVGSKTMVMTAERLRQSLDPLVAVRSDESGTRRRTIFCRLLSNHLRSRTGRWHDEEVAGLCEIALDCGNVEIDMVRSARRESTRTRKRRH